MIRPLRRAHLGASFLMAALLPAGVIAALRARHSMPVEAVAPRVEGAWTDRSAIWRDVAIETRALADGTLELTPRVDLRRADLLVYWRPRDSGEGLGDAHLLGPLAGTGRRRMQLPAAARTDPGELVLYALAHDELVATAPLPALEGEQD